MRIPLLAAGFAGIALLASFPGCSCTPSSLGPVDVAPKAGGASATAAGEAPAAAPSSGTAATQASTPLSAGCEAQLAEIKKLEAKIPIRFNFLPRPAEEIYKDINTCSDLCRRFLAECPGNAADCQVRRLLGRLLLTGSRFYQQELVTAGAGGDEITAKMEARVAEIRSLAGTALGACQTPSVERVKALRLIIDLCSEFGPPAELRKHAAILLAERPDLGDAADIHLAVARSYLSERDYEGAVKYLDAVIARDEKDPNVVLYNIVLFDALTGTGDLDRMEELMHIILADYPGRIEAGISGEPRVQAELWLDIATFWLGFVSYSLGHIQESENWFLKSEEHLETKIKERKAQGKPINPVVDVFLKFRTKDYRLYLRDFHGKVPEVDLDLGDLWATKSTLSFRESIGKVVAVVFREPGNDRAATFLQEIDGLVKQRGKDGLSGAVLSYVIGPERPGDAERLRAEMSADLEKLGVSLPAGYDPDRKSQSIMRRLHATVGPSTTCIVFNRRGEAAWYIADPRDMDRAIARRVIERLLKE